MKSDLLIRADGSSHIGLGHLIRCISLGIILKDQFRVTFVCRSLPRRVKKELDQQGFSLLKIDKEQSFFERISPKSIVVLDGYSFDAVYQKRIKKIGAALVCIDDLHDREFYSDLIINHAPGVRKEDYTAQPGTRFALGLEYALLRPPFLKAAARSQLQKKKTIETILICFGGSDSKNLTLRALNAVFDFNQFKKISIITGSAYSFKKELLTKIKNEKRVVHHHGLSGEEMAAVFLTSGAAIVPASGVLFEALATGNIAVSGTYTENQNKVYTGFKKLNAIIDAGEFSDREIRSAIGHIGRAKSREQLIDGKSPERIRNLFQTVRQD